jgi:hypothetical protein
MQGVPRSGPAARATLAIAIVVVGAMVGIVTAGAKKSPQPAAAPGLRADVLPGDLDGARAPRIRLADPRHDTPAAARRWLRVHGLPRQAHYLLGSSRQLLPVWRDWYVVPRTGGAGFDPTTHDAGIWLVDARGRLRGRWAGGAAPIAPGAMAHDLTALLDEAGHA